MVNEVGKLIYNALVKYHAVYLPDVGTLSVVRKAAVMSSKSELVAPRYHIEYSSNNCAKSLVDIISTEAAVDTRRAEEMYSRWLDKAREGSVVVVDRVGTLRDKCFIADNGLIKALNICEQPLYIARRKSHAPVFVTMMIILVLCAAGVGVWRCFNSKPAVETVELVAEEVATPLIEMPLIKEEQSFDIEPIEEIVEKVEILDVVADWRTREDIRHWVVVGSYSTTENAERAISDILKRHSETQCNYFKLGSMYAVAVFGSADVDECQQFKRTHTEEFPQSWVYTPKRFR